MKLHLNNLLLCPLCQGSLKVTGFETTDGMGSANSPGEGESEIISGVLACDCGALFPVIEGVPRLLRSGLQAFPNFIAANRAGIENIRGAGKITATRGGAGFGDDYDSIRTSFSQEWGIFDYENDKTWGWTLEERKEVFLSDVNLQPDELSGKNMLDAGCGNGTLTAALTAFGLEIVGMDLNDGLGQAFRNRSRYAASAVGHVEYVQGNLSNAPVKSGAFDLVYSSGVIHHTPSSKDTFASLVRVIRKGGRLYVWVYGRRGWPVRLFFGAGRELKRVLSLKSLMKICRAIAPFYKVVTSSLNALGLLQFRSRTTREITLDLFDGFAPRYNHWHTEAEVRSWFEEHGFCNIHVSGIQKHGFGMYGDKL